MFNILQPFRGNPDYDTVADLPFDTNCMEKLIRNQDEIHITSINKCRMETMYKTSCMKDKLLNNTSKVSSYTLSECIKSRRQDGNFVQSAVVPMWVVYQFFVSVVLLRILIVMLTITYNKILANLNNMWKYARLYLIIQVLLEQIIVILYIFFSKSAFSVLWCGLPSSSTIYIFITTDVSDYYM